MPEKMHSNTYTETRRVAQRHTQNTQTIKQSEHIVQLEEVMVNLAAGVQCVIRQKHFAIYHFIKALNKCSGPLNENMKI